MLFCLLIIKCLFSSRSPSFKRHKYIKKEEDIKYSHRRTRSPSRRRYRSSRSRDRSKSYDRSKSRYSSPSSSTIRHRSNSLMYNKSTSSRDANITERSLILSKWRKDYCATSEEISRKMQEISNNQDENLEKEKLIWIRTTPADLYYVRSDDKPKVIEATDRLLKLCNTFNEELVLRRNTVNDKKPRYQPPPRKNRARLCKHKCNT